MDNQECTLSNEELIKRCDEWVSRLCATGGNAWALSVPAQHNRDPDLLFIELGKRLADLAPTAGEDQMIFEAVPCDKELPKAAETYHCFLNESVSMLAFYDEDGRWFNGQRQLFGVTHWLRPAALSTQREDVERLREYLNLTTEGCVHTRKCGAWRNGKSWKPCSCGAQARQDRIKELRAALTPKA